MKGIPALRLSGLKRAAVTVAVGALVAGASMLGATQAHALTIVGGPEGVLTISPANGPLSSTPAYNVSQACPSTAQGSGTLVLNDPGGGGLDIIANTNNSVTGPFSGVIANPLSLEEQAFTDIVPGTTAEIYIDCTTQASGLGTHVASYDGFLTFNADNTYTFTAAPPTGPAGTTTTLTASTPAFAGENVTLTATVSGGTPAPTGTVTFENGSTVIGTGPVTLVNGVASVQTQFPAAGTVSLQAVYTPDDSTKFSTSTGTLSLDVTNPPPNSGVIPLAASVAATGAFQLSVDTTDTVTLTGSGTSASPATAATTDIGVSDTRNSFPGWSVSGQDGTWTGTGSAAGGTFSGDQLGWTPTDKVLAQAVTLGNPVSPANPGIGTTAAVLASVAAGLGNGFGTTTLGANLALVFPTNQPLPAGPYSSGLTISAVTSSP